MPQEYKRVLCPVDFSVHSARALQKAVSVVSLSRGELALVHIVRDPWSDLYNPDPETLLDPQEAEVRSRDMLQDFVHNYAPGVSCTFFVKRHEYVDRGIVDFTRAFRADLIVLSTHGRTGTKKLLIGSVAENLIRRAPCNILAVKAKDKDEKSVLTDKLVLAVDDEADILEIIAAELDMCLVHKVPDYETACEYLTRYRYDAVVLDIMGVNGFELLKKSVERGYPAVMLTAHAVTPEALKTSMELGAVFFLPKEKLTQLKGFLEDVVLEGGKPMWKKFLDRLGSYFDRRFGPGWIEKEKVFKELERDVRSQ